MRKHGHKHTHRAVLKPSSTIRVKILRAVGLCRADLQGRGRKTKALATWKNSCDLQEEVGHLRVNIWILSLLFWTKCQSHRGCRTPSQSALHPKTSSRNLSLTSGFSPITPPCPSDQRDLSKTCPPRLQAPTTRCSGAVKGCALNLAAPGNIPALKGLFGYLSKCPEVKYTVK